MPDPTTLYTPVDLSSAPGLPLYLPDPATTLGTPTWRWSGHQFDGVAAGTAVTRWDATNGVTAPMTNTYSGKQPPTVGSDAKGTFVSFNGVDQGIGAALPLSSKMTVCAVARIQAAAGVTAPVVGTLNGPQWTFGNYSGIRRVYAGAARDGGSGVATGALGAWQVAYAPGLATARVTNLAGNWSGSAGSNQPVELILAQHQAATMGKVDIYEVIVWDGVSASAAQWDALTAWASATWGL